jgi:hypothetical protein
MDDSPMVIHTHCTFQKVMKKLDGSRAWLSCSSRGGMLMHLSSKQNANTSSVQAMDLLAVAVN